MIAELLAWTGGILFYLPVWLLWARHLYGTWRKDWIDGQTLPYRDHVKRFDLNERNSYMIASMVGGAIWPVTLPVRLVGMGVISMLNSTPIKSQLEIDREREAQEKHIRDLEKQLDILEKRFT